MPRITLSIKSRKATREPLSIEDLKQRYLYGLPLEKDGKPIPDEVYQFFLDAAKKEIERYLTIKFDMQIIKETKDFNTDEWRAWNQVKCTYLIQAPVALSGYIGTIQQVDWPRDWLSVRQSSDGETFSRLMHVVPNAYSPYHQIAAIYTGFFPNAGAMGGGNATPEYWNVQYVTGFKKLPIDIEQAIGMLASLNVLIVANETLASAMGALGQSSKSISLDGLSQSISMYVNGQAGIFGARIKQYGETLMGTGGQQGLMDKLRDYYGNIIWAVA